MTGTWIVYWFVIFLSLLLSLVVIVKGALSKKLHSVLRGFGYLGLAIVVPVLSFLYSFGRSRGTNEFTYLFQGLLSFNLAAYVITLGYALLVYCFIKSLRQILPTGKSANGRDGSDRGKFRSPLIVFFVALGLLLTVVIHLLMIREEFKDYLGAKYPGQTFDIGFVSIDPIYSKYVTRVTSLDDYTSFSISKGFKSKTIIEDYPQSKSQMQYNSKLKNTFGVSDLDQYIISVTGGAETQFTDGGNYDQIFLTLTPEAELAPTTKKILDFLKERKISAETVLLIQEKEGHVFELKVSTKDSGLTEKELAEKVVHLK